MVAEKSYIDAASANGFRQNSLSGKAFETKLDSNSIESSHPRTASFKQLYGTGPDFPNLPAHLLRGASDTALAFPDNLPFTHSLCLMR